MRRFQSLKLLVVDNNVDAAVLEAWISRAGLTDRYFLDARRSNASVPQFVRNDRGTRLGQ